MFGISHAKKHTCYRERLLQSNHWSHPFQGTPFPNPSWSQNLKYKGIASVPQSRGQSDEPHLWPAWRGGGCRDQSRLVCASHSWTAEELGDRLADNEKSPNLTPSVVQSWSFVGLLRLRSY